MARILYGDKFPFVHLWTSMYCHLLMNFSDLTYDTTECRLMT